MLLREFLENDIDNLTEQDYISIKNQISDLDKLKKAANEKIKADVNYSDIKALTKALTDNGLSYTTYKDFYQEYLNKYWDGGEEGHWTSQGANILRDYKDKEVAPNLDLYYKLKNKLENDHAERLDNSKEYQQYKQQYDTLKTKYSEIEKKEEELSERLEKEETINYYDNKFKNIKGAYWVFYYTDDLYGNGDLSSTPKLDQQSFNKANNATSGWTMDELIANFIATALKKQVEERVVRHSTTWSGGIGKWSRYKYIPTGIEWLKGRLNELKNVVNERSSNTSFKTPFDKWLNYAIKGIDSVLQDLFHIIDFYVNPVIEERNKLKNLKEKINSLDTKITDLSNSLYDNNLKDEIKKVQATAFYNRFNYKMLWNQKAVDEYIQKRYLKYLVSILNKYIAELMDKLQIIRGRYGIGKGTGDALTRFRHYEEDVNNILSEAEKAMLMGWLCKHIRRMMVHVMEGGASEKVFNLLFPNVHNYDTALKSNDNAWDARAGEIIIDSEENITPKIQELFNKVTSKKTQTSINNKEQESGRFMKNRLNSAPFVYLLLNQYYNFGFTLGDIAITPEQAYELQRSKFPQNEKAFDKGYNS